MKPVTKIISTLLTLIMLGALFVWRASQNLERQNYTSANFFVFWLSGRLLLDGQSPYNAEQWAEGHANYGEVEPREPTFLYPLPLAVFLIPLGLLPVGEAYFIWQILSQTAIAFVVFALLGRWRSESHQRLLVPAVLFLSFFGPVYLTLQIGSLGPLTLLFVFGALHFLDREQSFAAGLLLSLTMLKPSQGITLLLLIGLVFLLRRDWKAIAGITVGGIALLLIGLLLDTNWVSSFQQSSQAAFDRRLGVQPNVWSFSYLACNGNSTCYYNLGTAAMLTLLSGTSYYLWRCRLKMTNWQIFNFIIPIAFVSTLYLWAYDQILYMLPVIWILGTLVEKRRSYIPAILFLIVLDLFSFFALAQQALTGKDLWSLGTTFIILVALFATQRMRKKLAPV